MQMPIPHKQAHCLSSIVLNYDSHTVVNLVLTVTLTSPPKKPCYTTLETYSLAYTSCCWLSDLSEGVSQILASS